jgi:hypothetical protein
MVHLPHFISENREEKKKQAVVTNLFAKKKKSIKFVAVLNLETNLLACMFHTHRPCSHLETNLNYFQSVCS